MNKQKKQIFNFVKLYLCPIKIEKNSYNLIFQKFGQSNNLVLRVSLAFIDPHWEKQIAVIWDRLLADNDMSAKVP